MTYDDALRIRYLVNRIDSLRNNTSSIGCATRNLGTRDDNNITVKTPLMKVHFDHVSYETMQKVLETLGAQSEKELKKALEDLDGFTAHNMPV